MNEELKPRPAASVDREALVNVIYDALDFDMTGRGTAVEIANVLIDAGWHNRPEAVVRDEVISEILPLLNGIDRTETDDPYGWWETTKGAMFGQLILGRITALITAPSETAGDKVEVLVTAAQEMADACQTTDFRRGDRALAALLAALASIGGQRDA